MEALLPIIIQVVTGIIGGQAVGAALKQVDMSQVIKIISAVWAVSAAACCSAGWAATPARSAAFWAM